MRILVPSVLYHQNLFGWATYELKENIHSVTFDASFGLLILKVHKHEIFFLTFFAETETIWSQGPVTRDF